MKHTEMILYRFADVLSLYCSFLPKIRLNLLMHSHQHQIHYHCYYYTSYERRQIQSGGW